MKTHRYLVVVVISLITLALIVPGPLLISTYAAAVPISHIESGAPKLTSLEYSSSCEDFDSGFTLGTTIGVHPQWFDGGAGPIVNSGLGVAGSVGLSPANDIFIWDYYTLSWSDPQLQSVKFRLDIQSDSEGKFNDDRIGWMIVNNSVDSTNFFGVQLDTEDGGITTYWRHGSDRIQDPIVGLTGIKPNTFYRFWTQITKLTATSAKVEVMLTELDASGNPTGTPIYGYLDDTSAWGSGGSRSPDSRYFTSTNIWPAYKNYSTNPGNADNACYEVIPRPSTQHSLTVNIVGNGSVTRNPDKTLYNYGEVVQLTAVPEAGWKFKQWGGDASGTANPTTVTITKDMVVSATFVKLPPSGGLCEGYESGFTIGSTVGAHADWFDNNGGPVITAGNGVNGSIGLAPANNIFTWTGQPFQWSDENTTGVAMQMDFQADGSGHFDDDRIGWMITDSNVDSSNFFGVQLDTSDGGIVTYWRNSSNERIQTPIVALSGIKANTWYRFRAEFTKLTNTSARIDVSLVELTSSGDPVGTPITGVVADTSSWAGGAPASKYFPSGNIWPSYKNFSAIVGASDNACYELFEQTEFAFVVITDLHTSSNQSSVTANMQQIRNWIDAPTTEMPAPEFMVVTGDFPNLSQTESIIDSVIAPDFVWYPVIGNHEISDDINNFYQVRNNKVPSLPNIVNYGPTGSTNTTYSWDYGNAHFVVVNAYWNGTTGSGADFASDGDIPLALRNWLDADLTSTDKLHRFAFVHEPAYPEHRHVGDSLDKYPANRDAFVTLLDSQEVETLFTGHTHYYERETAATYPLLGDMTQITNGAFKGNGDIPTITYVKVKGGQTVYKVYQALSGSTFTLLDEWTVDLEPPTEPPQAPTGLTTTAVSATQIDLAWVDNATNESQFVIERSTTGASGPFTTLTNVPANSETYSDTSLTPDTQYCYRVKATNIVGSSAYTNVSCATTLALTCQVNYSNTFDDGYMGLVKQPTGGPDLPITSSWLGYNPKNADLGLSLYTLSDPVGAGIPDLVFGNLPLEISVSNMDLGSGNPPAETKMVIAGLALRLNGSGSDWDGYVGYQLRALDLFNKLGYTPELLGDFTDETNTPNVLTIARVVDGVIQDPVLNPGTGPVLARSGYWIARYTEDHSFVFKAQGDDLVLSVNYPDLNSGVGFVVEISAEDSLFTSGYAGLVMQNFNPTGSERSFYDYNVAYACGGPFEPPEAPSDLQAHAVSAHQINLSWVDNSTTEDHFVLERSTTGASGPFSFLANVTANSTTYTDESLDSEQEYCYRVKAQNSWGDSAYSDVACATTPAPPEPEMGICESFEVGYTLGAELNTHPDWFYELGHSGPKPQAGIGVNASIGLTGGDRIFTWKAHPFSWNDPDFEGVGVWMDFQTDASGHFDDDRLGWMISITDDDSSNIFGIQLDPGGTGYNIEGYWDGVGGADKRPSIVSLPPLTANTWYRLTGLFTKLGPTAARIDAKLELLDSAGNVISEVVSGSIPDTSALGSDAPDPKYFSATQIWPAFKNYNAIAGAADNACYALKGLKAPQVRIELNSGNPRLRWDDGGAAVLKYEVWRASNAPYFTPGASGSEKIGELSGGLGSEYVYDDVGSGVGNPADNSFYVVRAVGIFGGEADSNRVGEMDFEMVGGAYNTVSVPLEDERISDAEELGDMLGAELVGRWIKDTQSLDLYLVGAGLTPFDVEVGQAYFVYIGGGGGIYTTVGGVPEAGSVSFEIERGEVGSCKLNLLTLPLDQDGIVNAQGMGNAIGGVQMMMKWMPMTSSFTIWMMEGGVGDNFSTWIGYPYWPCADLSGGGSTWP